MQVEVRQAHRSARLGQMRQQRRRRLLHQRVQRRPALMSCSTGTAVITSGRQLAAISIRSACRPCMKARSAGACASSACRSASASERACQIAGRVVRRGVPPAPSPPTAGSGPGRRPGPAPRHAAGLPGRTARHGPMLRPVSVHTQRHGLVVPQPAPASRPSAWPRCTARPARSWQADTSTVQCVPAQHVDDQPLHRRGCSAPAVP
jgi:hypothetical protein